MRRHPQVLIASPTGPVTRSAAPRSAASHFAPAPRVAPSLLLAAALAAVLAACKTVDEAPGTASRANVGARLVPTGGSTMTGGVAFRQVEGGVVIVANLAGGTPGQWRVVIHANGICTSPNGFAAGPPLMLPGTSLPAAVQISTNANGGPGLSARLPGLALDGPASIIGKSVVVHAGALGSLEARPDVPNNRVACGVIESMRPLF